MDKTDNHNAPFGVHAQRRIDRGIDELLGMCKGIIADKVVNQDEADFLLNWIESNQELRSEWPVNIIYRRITDFMEDGKLDAKEQKELFNLLKCTAGDLTEFREENCSTTLPLEASCPEIIVENSLFCFTGKFIFGTRSNCESEIKNLGGKTHKDPGQKTDYLVIGTLGSRDWMHSSFGRKIEKAVGLREAGHSVKILSEQMWIESLFG